MTSMTALIVVAGGAILLRWTDLFHLSIVLPTLIAALLFGLWRSTSVDVAEDIPALHADEESPLVRVLRGGVVGAVLLVCSAAALSAAARTPLYGWFYDRDLEALLEHVDVLEGAGAYDKAVRLMDDRRARVLSSTALDRLDDRR